ncbi:DUF397 domain-containing protein [Actinomadura macrotermitis]|uniref:DUF397 domain-containing protein n=1 Tax=Actinomadura macrotermitis TaxID=2585200 RepID=UPI002E2575D8
MDLSRLEWRKSSRSSSNGQCVECAEATHFVAVRDSKDPDEAVLVVGRAAWRAFLGQIKAGSHAF